MYIIDNEKKNMQHMISSNTMVVNRHTLFLGSSYPTYSTYILVYPVKLNTKMNTN